MAEYCPVEAEARVRFPSGALMREYITGIQLVKLSDKAKEKYKKYFSSKYNTVRFVSVIEMIDFLDKKWEYLRIAKWKFENGKKLWAVSSTKSREVWSRKLLVNALWAATKDVLENE